LRQAYDYWQDQPGNYYPNHLRETALLLSKRQFQNWEFIKRLKNQSQHYQAFQMGAEIVT